MEIDDYQKAVAALEEPYPHDLGFMYNCFANGCSTGVLSNKVKDILMRPSGEFTETDKEDFLYILGDMLHRVSALANSCGLSLNDIAATNISVLKTEAVKRGAMAENGIFRKPQK